MWADYDLTPSECLPFRSGAEVHAVHFVSHEIYDQTGLAAEPLASTQGMLVIWSDGTVDQHGFYADEAFELSSSGDGLSGEYTVELVGEGESNPTKVSVDSIEESFGKIGNVDGDYPEQICWSDRLALLALPHADIGQFGYRARGDIDLDGDVDADDYVAFNALPCSADLNCDGAVDIIDYLDYLDAHSNDDPLTDMNGDATIDVLDMLDFLDAYSVGC